MAPTGLSAARPPEETGGQRGVKDVAGNKTALFFFSLLLKATANVTGAANRCCICF